MRSDSVGRHRAGVAPVISRTRAGFTLVEILIVAFIMMLLAGIALPAVRNVLKDSRKSKGAREVVAFINEARARAIATGRETGIVIRRFGTENDYLRSVSNEIRLSNGAPAYPGESAGARATLFHDPNPSGTAIPSALAPGVYNAAFFPANEAPLLFLSAANGGTGDSPIRRFDRLELPGRRSMFIRRIKRVGVNDISGVVAGTIVTFLSQDVIERPSADPDEVFPTVEFPSSEKSGTVTRQVPYRILREPMVSSVGALSLARGFVIDLNYSGIGDGGNQFAFSNMPASDRGDLKIVFAPDGSISYVTFGNQVTSLGVVRSRPIGNIYLCLGKTDGVRPDDLLSTEDRATANVLDPETVWVTINASTGFVTASPAASVDLESVSSVQDAVRESRAFAVRADSLSSY